MNISNLAWSDPASLRQESCETRAERMLRSLRSVSVAEFYGAFVVSVETS
jgi:hypothetical protein